VSTEEQDAILGRTIRLRKQASEELALIDAKLEEFRRGLRELGIYIHKRKQGESAAEIPQEISKLADFPGLLALLDERDSLMERIRGYTETMERCGL
jgi:hypothetical protein